MVGGVTSVASGGKFGHGFVAAGFAKGIGTPIYDASGGNAATGFVATVVVGGTASELSGGKFANGAKTAAYQFLFNTIGKEVKGILMGDPDPVEEATKATRGKYEMPEKFDHAWRNACSNNPIFDACLAAVDMVEEYSGLDHVKLPSKWNWILLGAREFGKQGFCLANANCNIVGLKQDEIYNPQFDDPKWQNEMIRRSNGLPENEKWYE